MTDPASLNVHIELTGLDRYEATNVLTTAFAGMGVDFNVTQPAIGGRRYAAKLPELSVDDAWEILGQLRAQWTQRDETTGHPSAVAHDGGPDR